MKKSRRKKRPDPRTAMQAACMAMSTYHGSRWATKYVMEKVERRFGPKMARAYLGLVEALGEVREGPFPDGYEHKPGDD